MRLPYNANTEDEVRTYYDSRSRQLLYSGYIWSEHLAPFDGAYHTTFVKDQRVYTSVFVPVSARGKGLYRKFFSTRPGCTVLTSSDCHIVDTLKHLGVDYVCEDGLTETLEYKSIVSFYGNTKAARSGTYYMNHIDEGLAVLQHIDATENARRAFCLHPLFQRDQELKVVGIDYARVGDAIPITLAVEYRSVANEYLAHRKIQSQDDIRLSPLEAVNEMLVADKIQNYKDFLLYHSSHARAVELDQYFKNWLIKLGIDAESAYELMNMIAIYDPGSKPIIERATDPNKWKHDADS